MISINNLEKTKDAIKKEKHPIIIEGKSSEFNRSILEYGHFDVLLSIEAEEKKKSIRQVYSGFNHVLAKIAKKNGIALGINIEEISKLNGQEKADRLSKIIQNIKICRKSNVKIAILNCKDKRNAFSFLVSLGASTKQAKEAISF